VLDLFQRSLFSIYIEQVDNIQFGSFMEVLQRHSSLIKLGLSYCSFKNLDLENVNQFNSVLLNHCKLLSTLLLYCRSNSQFGLGTVSNSYKVASDSGLLYECSERDDPAVRTIRIENSSSFYDQHSIWTRIFT
jgi:hypothetical protein